ncbi:MAG: LysM peptidoglycan-binding domain-containing protein [Liquorilactobacillus nagelii]|jgi:LysM repeat protein|uniref:Peptidoglycan-binding protein LysM n=1 Tax=Liquorilactobacillus nagelii TaxID=82688 RepID=A0A3S6QYW2_9LACO|nr:LysM peptidoglycan-binding domain-containing protein [Liquorilactobacillus nagelii]AUJ31385.1 peptidoglycan-binding protein LysM [Liquorilactobacillus nagelii]MCC7616800.1 peptidoglycan-binding protein LysM [Liquorilactobacillus nagelii]MCI1700766.1 LysM peptidoglycan-binding domain-containing protein [Liquorilactobacillus nagelii]MCP9315608.1 LysM peptidoglycan-binding domain-containing protein [Liquorilactobacillus nagelii]ULQ49416.1 LysM peptidoglycan-binding domain-containing protein [L
MDIKKILLSAATVTGMMTVGTVAANADTVTVKAGDTVSALAHEYGTTVDAIKQSNQLQNENLIFVGEQLQVNGTSTNSQATTTQSNTATTQSTQNAAQTTQSTQNAAQTTQTQSTPAVQQTTTTTENTATTTTSSTSSSEDSARAWIANRESGGSYTASNGNYYGKYQLSTSYLNGDYSAANQERVANQYVTSRYGSWQGALNHWKAYGWY